MRILIYGAGAIGSDLGALLSATGEDVQLLARGAQLAALQANGVTVEYQGQPSVQVPVKALSAEECSGRFDLIFVTLKSTQLAAAAKSIVSLLAPDGVMVMIQNGLPWWYFDGVESAHQGARLSCLDPDGVLQRDVGKIKTNRAGVEFFKRHLLHSKRIRARVEMHRRIHMRSRMIRHGKI